MSNTPYLDTMIGLGLNPKTGLPVKMGPAKCDLKNNIKMQLRIIDEQDAVNRYVWNNLPNGLTSQELERMIYYKGQLCFFKEKITNKFYFMPYSLNGTIDYYGRYNTVKPLPFNASGDEKDNGNKYLSSLKLEVVYDKENYDIEKENCVLLCDYTKQLTQNNIPRVSLNEGLLDVMSDVIPFMRTALIAGTGVKGVRVNDADQADSVKVANNGMEQSALNGNPFVPIVGKMEFQELTNNQVAKSEEYMLSLQSLDNFRLSTYGIQNGGLFQKKAHELETEAEMNNYNNNLVYTDGLKIRQNFCEIANKVFGLNISCNEMEQEVVEEREEEADVQHENDDTNME